MKVVGFACDRCSEHFNRNTVVPKDRKVTDRIISVGLIDENGVMLQIDLCDNCLRKFFDFVGDKWEYLRVSKKVSL